MNKMLIVAFFTGSTVLRAQSLNIDFGSTFDPNTYDALRFANADGIRFDTNLPGGEVGIITVGYFDDIGSQTTFADYLNDFTQVGFESAFVAGADGYLQASTNTKSSIPANIRPYVFVLGGVSDFTDAALATSFSIISDTSWSDFFALGVIPPTLDLLTLQPSDIVVGSPVSMGDGVDLTAVAVNSVVRPIPEPSTSMLLLSGLLTLNGYIFICRSCS